MFIFNNNNNNNNNNNKNNNNNVRYSYSALFYDVKDTTYSTTVGGDLMVQVAAVTVLMSGV